MAFLSDKQEVKVNSLKAWYLAARPKTLTGAATPVMIGASLAIVNSSWAPRIIPMVLCFLFAFIMQIDANFVNDYFDFKRGNDDETRLGPKRACAEGWITPSAMRIGIVITTVIACLVGLPLVIYGGFSMIIVGALCILFCFLYTTKLSYIGLGDLLVLVFFGLVPVMLTYYLCMPEGQQQITWEVLTASVACGFVIDALLVVNNFRDIDNDRKAGKRTLVVMIGAKNALRLYFSIGFIACILCFITVFYQHSAAFYATIVYLALHLNTYQKMATIKKGRELNSVLGLTARNIFVFGVCFSLGVLVS